MADYYVRADMVPLERPRQGMSRERSTYLVVDTSKVVRHPFIPVSWRPDTWDCCPLLFSHDRIGVRARILVRS